MQKNYILHDAFQLLSETIIVTDGNDVIIYISPNCESVIGLSEDMVRGRRTMSNMLIFMGNGSLSFLVKEKPNSAFELNFKAENGDCRHLSIKSVFLEKVDATTAYVDATTAYVFCDITEQKNKRQRDRNLKKRNKELELQLEEQEEELKRKNIALAEVLNHLEVERSNLARKIDVNIRKLLLPVLEKLIEKSSSFDSRYLTMIKQNLQTLTSSLGIKLSSVEYQLTPKEIELCALIKGGFAIKEIASMHNLSVRTIETHRFNIRKKLGISSSRVNLASFLAEL